MSSFWKVPGPGWKQLRLPLLGSLHATPKLPVGVVVSYSPLVGYLKDLRSLCPDPGVGRMGGNPQDPQKWGLYPSPHRISPAVTATGTRDTHNSSSEGQAGRALRCRGPGLEHPLISLHPSARAAHETQQSPPMSRLAPGLPSHPAHMAGCHWGLACATRCPTYWTAQAVGPRPSPGSLERSTSDKVSTCGTRPTSQCTPELPQGPSVQGTLPEATEPPAAACLGKLACLPALRCADHPPLKVPKTRPSSSAQNPPQPRPLPGD